MNRMNQRGGIASILLITLGTVVLLEGIQFWAHGSDYFMYRFFAPKQEAVRRETFEQSKAYNDGMAQELWDMELQYAKADKAGRESLRSIIVHRTAAYDTTRLPEELQRFVAQVRSEQLEGMEAK